MSPTKSVTRVPSAVTWSFLKCSKSPRIRTSPLPFVATVEFEHVSVLALGDRDLYVEIHSATSTGTRWR